MISIKDLSVSFDKHQVLKTSTLILKMASYTVLLDLTVLVKQPSLMFWQNAETGFGLYYTKWYCTGYKDTAYLETNNYFFSRITGGEYLKIFKQTNEAFDLAVLQEYFKLPLDELIENYSTGMKKNYLCWPF